MNIYYFVNTADADQNEYRLNEQVLGGVCNVKHVHLHSRYQSIPRR